MEKRSSFSCWCASFVHRTWEKCLLWRQSGRTQNSSDMHTLKRISWRKSDMWVTELLVGWENQENLPNPSCRINNHEPPPIIRYFAPKIWTITLLKLVMTWVLLSKTSGCRHTKWTELSTGKVNQDWASASLILTLQSDRLYSIQLWTQQLYR